MSDVIGNRHMNEVEKLLDPQLWHACANGMVQLPPVNSKVFYFPQGHAEHAQNSVDFGMYQRIPPLILCRVSSVKHLANPETDEVKAKIGLVPLGGNELDVYADVEFFGFGKNENRQEKPNSFAKTLTQSDANNGGGFSVPRYCAETIFPPLDYEADPPVQNIIAKDVHGDSWQFRHIYRGTPRRHLLTTGWSNFVNQKRLIAGDSIVFMRKENGEIHAGIRRGKKGNSTRPEALSGWYTKAFGISGEGNRKVVQKDASGRSDVSVESVRDAVIRAVNGQAFEVVYYPLACSPEFVVRASAVRDAMRIKWCPGLRIKMPLETEDSSQVSWFTGIVSSVEAEDPVKWPGSPWRLLQVAWDEPELLQNVKRVSPWQVELVPDMFSFHQSHISPLRKKLKLPQPPQFPLIGQLQAPPLFHNPLIPSSLLADNFPAGIQGARQANRVLSSIDLHSNAMNVGPLAFGLREAKTPKGYFVVSSENEENVSCLLTMGGNNSPNLKKNDGEGPKFMLFGKPIFCSGEKTTNVSDGSGSAVLEDSPPLDSSSDGVFPRYKEQRSELGSETGNCEKFTESEDVGQTPALSPLSSFQ